MYGFGYTTLISSMGKGGPALTVRTTAFATATGITDTTILNALNTFDLGLISNGLDTKMKALYPFVGGTATTHKFNFMDARDLDAAFRLTFNGGWTHSSNGCLPNGTNAYANTYLTPSLLLQNSNHISYYSRTSAASTTQDAGALNTTLAGRYELLLRYTDNMSYNTLMSTVQTGVSVTDARAYWIMSRTNSNEISQFKNNTKIATTTQPSISPSSFNRTIYWGQSNGQSSFSNKEIAFGTIGDGLSDAEVSTFYTLVQTFQTSLGRQV